MRNEPQPIPRNSLVKAKEAIEKMGDAQSLYNLGPIEAKMRDQRYLRLDRVQASGITLRLSVVGLESGQLRYVDEEGYILELRPDTGKFSDTGKGRVDLVKAVLASAAIPIIFPLVELAGEHYVDGGVREVIPVRAAVAAGASDIYAILAGSPIKPSGRSFTNAGIPEIGLRSIADCMVDEIRHNDFRPIRGWDPHVNIIAIEPTEEVHDALTIDPGLIDIAMDYGYMRAGDIVEELKDEDRARCIYLSDEITRRRQLCWEVEFSANGKSRAGGALWPDPYALDSVRGLKREVHRLAVERNGLQGPMPAGSDAWWQGWERHQWGPIQGSPWDAFYSPLDNRSAEEPPPPLNL